MGFSADEAVEIWQSPLALTAGFSLFASGHAATDTRGLPATLRERADQWSDEAFHRALLAILESHNQARTPGAPGVGLGDDAGWSP